MEMSARVRVGETIDRDVLLRKLVDMQYRRNDINLVRGTFRVRGDTLEFVGVEEELVHRIEFFGDEIESINVVNLLTGEYVESEDRAADLSGQALHHARREAAGARSFRSRKSWTSVWPTSSGTANCSKRSGWKCARATTSTCCAKSATATASRTTRATSPGANPARRRGVCIDFFPKDWLLFVDESHVTLPQVHGMYGGDRSRKEVLVEHGFRLPSALDNRPLTFEEFDEHINQAIYVSATPRAYERELQRAGRRDDHPPDRPGRSRGRGASDPQSGRRSHGRDRAARGPSRTRAGDDADQEDGRRSDRFLARERPSRALPAQRGRHARTHRDPARSARRRLRRAGRHQSACAKVSICRRSRWSASSTPTKRATCAAAPR